MKTIIYNNIDEVPKDHWDSLQQGHSSTYAYEFWAILERAKLNDFRYRYAIFYDDNGIPLAFTSFYTITTDIAIFATGELKTTIAKIRKFFPGFFQLKMLECGTPITLNKPFVAGNHISNIDMVTALNDMLMSLAKQQGHFLIVVRDFEAETAAIQPLFTQLGYHVVDSLPTTYMEIIWKTPADYLAAMKSYYRSKLLKHLRINEKQGIRHELHDDFDHLADTLCDQWLVVHNHASEYQREILTPEFYRGFSAELGARSKAILFYRKDELIGHALLLMDGTLLRWLYFGRTDAVNDSLYIYVAHKVVETAINLGATRLELGLTTYPIKKDLGAYMSPLKLALKAPSRLVNPFVGFFYPLLNQTPEIHNKSIFK
jgi:predicted N-acyltransferase